MSTLFIYLSKLSVSLAVVYLFYKLFLQYLTFYNWNRWYLSGYSLLSFLIPFINISPVLEENKWSDSKVVQVIPEVSDLTNKHIAIPHSSAPALYSVTDLLFVIFLAGIIVMLVRLILQWISYLNIKRNAKLLLKDQIDLYEVSERIVPFSFGRCVFINQQSHNEEDLREIIRHEWVHVRQKHTIDIVWAEILCLFNWYNPFAWLIRHHIRQNLEFIADSKVLENGIDKKQYQYLLLKVMGIPQFQIAAPFNFSSLKKRIVMMNKIKSARVHLVKFLFVLPLLAVLLIAFRSKISQDKNGIKNEVMTISGVVVQGDNYEPLSNVRYQVEGSNIEGITDEKGYYTYSLPVTSHPQEVNTLFSKEGYKPNEANRKFAGKTNYANSIHVEIIGLTAESAETKRANSFVHSTLLTGITDAASRYESVMKKFEEIKVSNNEKIALKKLSKDSEKPYWIINGHTYILGKGEGFVSWDTIVRTVIVDAKKMTGDEVNLKIKRSSIISSAAKKDGADEYVFEISTDPENKKTGKDDNSRVNRIEVIYDTEVEYDGDKANTSFVNVAAKENISNTTKSFYPPKLVILDGQKMSWKEFQDKKIDKRKIACEALYQTLSKYGQDGRHGVLIITTKQNGEKQTFEDLEYYNLNKPLYYGAQVRPSYPGGKEAFINFIKANLRYPQEAMNRKIEVRASIRLAVDYDGTVYFISPITNWGYGFEKEMVRLIANSGKLIPATYNERPVPCPVNLSIDFGMQNVSVSYSL